MFAVPGIPLVDEDGAEIVESEDDSNVAAGHFKQSIYSYGLHENINIESASKILNNIEPLDIKLSLNKRRTS